MMNWMIRAKNVFKTYPNGFQALKGIDLEIADADFFTLLGPNGAGKSTLLKVLSGLLRVDQGEIKINSLNPEKHFLQIQRFLGVCSQDNDLDPTDDVISQLIFQGRLFGMTYKEATKRAEELADLFMLNDEVKKKAQDLSGGNKRKLHCALALVHNPKLLFLDEPTVGMDPLARDNFWRVICHLNQSAGVSIFLTTQYLEEADKHASHMALIIQGNLHFNGLVKDFKLQMHPESSLNLEESYLKYVRSLTEKGENHAV